MKNKSILILCMVLTLLLTIVTGCGTKEKAAAPQQAGEQKRDVVASQG